MSLNAQDRDRVAIGRPGRYTRRDGQHLLAQRNTNAVDPEMEAVKASHARLESLFDTEKALFTTMALTFR